MNEVDRWLQSITISANGLSEEANHFVRTVNDFFGTIVIGEWPPENTVMRMWLNDLHKTAIGWWIGNMDDYDEDSDIEIVFRFREDVTFEYGINLNTQLFSLFAKGLLYQVDVSTYESEYHVRLLFEQKENQKKGQ